MDRIAYLHALADAYGFGAVAVSYSVPLLEKLLSHSDLELKEYACVGLGRVFHWADHCLTRIVDNGRNLKVREQARELIQSNVKIRAAEERELRLAPAVFFSRITYRGAQEARFVLERLRGHSDSVVRTRVTDLLNQMSAVGY